MRAFPIAPLVALYGTMTMLAEAVGFAPATLYRMAPGGYLSGFDADRLACRVGLHPSSVWGESWWDETRALSDRLASELAS